MNYEYVVKKVAEGMNIEDALYDFQNEYFENRSKFNF